MSDYYNREKEYMEAIRAGDAALNSLYAARNYLNSARRWGIFDILGGGLLAGIVKHNYVNDARRCIEDARERLNIFRNELDDIQDLPNLHIDISDFLTLADFVFDGMIADIMVQQRIAQAKIQVEDAIPLVEDALYKLRRKLNEP